MNFTRSFGSQQWRILRRALRDGASLEVAADRAGMSLGEAKALADLDRKNPPPPEAYELLRTNDAPAAASPQAKEASMAKEEEDGAGEYKRPDAELAFKIYDQQIKPKEAHLATIKGDMSEPYQTIKDTAHYPRKVLNFIVGLENEEDAKRDHLLLALADGLKHRKLFLPRDLVTMANGEDEGDIVPTGEREDDELLVDGDEDEDEDDDLPLAASAADDEDGEDDKPKPRGRGRRASVSSINPPARDASAGQSAAVLN